MAVSTIKKTRIRQPDSHWPDRATRIQAGKVKREIEEVSGVVSRGSENT
jgi:hypothetical protein